MKIDPPLAVECAAVKSSLCSGGGHVLVHVPALPSAQTRRGAPRSAVRATSPVAEVHIAPFGAAPQALRQMATSAPNFRANKAGKADISRQAANSAEYRA